MKRLTFFLSLPMLLCFINLNAQCWVEASNHTYTLYFDFTIAQVNPVQSSCTNGYDFTVDVQYSISSTGVYKSGNIHSIDADVYCYGALSPHNAALPLPLDTFTGVATTGLLTTNSINCDTDTPISLLCNNMVITAIGKMFATYDQVCLPGYALYTELLESDIRSSADGDITFEWSTAVEKGTHQYLVEHLYDTEEFELLEVVDAQGNSEKRTDYAVTLNRAESGTHYFKLMEVDLDGDTTFLTLMSYKLSSSEFITVYPNPSIDGKFIVEGKDVEALQYQLFDIQGKLIQPMEYSQLEQESRVLFNLNGLPRGVYRLKASNAISYNLVVI